tara:strand:- start:1154 stop:1354 length:201 start_codon:yes stop_codon:yes gene_type:complete
MVEIAGWAIWDCEDWSVDHSNIYPTKVSAMEAAKKHYSYLGDTEEDYGDHMVVEVAIKFHTKHLFE